MELPPFEEIEKMDMEQQKWIDALDISDGTVKCQKCGLAVPLGKGLVGSSNGRIKLLSNRIKHLEYHHNKRNMSDSEFDKSIRETREELDSLLKEEVRRDLVRKLPLYSSRITKFRYVCSRCYDKIYYVRHRTRKKL